VCFGDREESATWQHWITREMVEDDLRLYVFSRLFVFKYDDLLLSGASYKISVEFILQPKADFGRQIGIRLCAILVFESDEGRIKNHEAGMR
jgi:hypothetical protein